VRLRRTVWRHVPRATEPLHLGWILRARGRWNLQRPRIACLYTAYTRAGALAEYDKLAQEPVFGRQPRDLVSIHVDVEPVLDLCDPRLQARYGITLDQLRGDRASDLSACRRVMRVAVQSQGYRAIRAPSAAAEGEINLMVYPASTAGRLLLTNGNERLAINYVPTPLRRGTRLAEASGKLDPVEERALAEEGLGSDAASWPKY
jgi:RES domain-containing protein